MRTTVSRYTRAESNLLQDSCTIKLTVAKDGIFIVIQSLKALNFR